MENRTVVLRKSWNRFSAGTPVTIIPKSEHYDNYMGGKAVHIRYLDGVEDTILLSYLTVRRTTAFSVPANNRHKRREVKRRTYKTLQNLMNK